MSFDPDAAALPGQGIFGLPHTPDDAQVVLIPVPWDATTSYHAGTARGPKAILRASHQVDLFDVETGRPYQSGIAMLAEPPDVQQWNQEARRAAEKILEMGGQIDGHPELEATLARVNSLGDQLNHWVYQETRRWLHQGKRVGIVGGDHAVPFGAIQALAEHHTGMGILHIDAHADLRQAYAGFVWSHASIFYNVCERIPQVARVVQVAVRDIGEREKAYIDASTKLTTFFDADLAAARFRGESWAVQCARIVAALPQDVYVSFDIDGLDPALCPHTGTPVPGGLGFAQASFLLGQVVKSGRRIVGFDLCEVKPSDDPRDEWDANVGARMLYKLIGWMLVR